MPPPLIASLPRSVSVTPVPSGAGIRGRGRFQAGATTAPGASRPVSSPSRTIGLAVDDGGVGRRGRKPCIAPPRPGGSRTNSLRHGPDGSSGSKIMMSAPAAHLQASRRSAKTQERRAGTWVIWRTPSSRPHTSRSRTPGAQEVGAPVRPGRPWPGGRRPSEVPRIIRGSVWDRRTAADHFRGLGAPAHRGLESCRPAPGRGRSPPGATPLGLGQLGEAAAPRTVPAAGSARHRSRRWPHWGAGSVVPLGGIAVVVLPPRTASPRAPAGFAQQPAARSLDGQPGHPVPAEHGGPQVGWSR